MLVLTSHERSSPRSSHTSPHQTVSILSQVLSLLAALLGLAPTMTFPMVKHKLLSDIYQLHIPHSCLVPCLTLFSHFSLADLQISTITHHTYALTDTTIREDRPRVLHCRHWHSTQSGLVTLTCVFRCISVNLFIELAVEHFHLIIILRSGLLLFYIKLETILLHYSFSTNSSFLCAIYHVLCTGPVYYLLHSGPLYSCISCFGAWYSTSS